MICNILRRVPPSRSEFVILGQPALLIPTADRWFGGFHSGTFLSFQWHHYSVKSVNLKPQAREEKLILDKVDEGVAALRVRYVTGLKLHVAVKDTYEAADTKMCIRFWHQTCNKTNTHRHIRRRYRQEPSTHSPARSQFYAEISGCSHPGNELSKSSKWPHTNTWTPLRVLKADQASITAAGALLPRCIIVARLTAP